MRNSISIVVVVSALALAGTGRADAPPGATLMDEGWARKASGDLAGAAAAFEEARAAGFDAQRVDLELSYVALSAGRIGAARERLRSAIEGPDPSVAAKAREELEALRRPLRRDLYAEAAAWTRPEGPERRANAVPMLRLRALYQPLELAPLDVYLFGQVTRDLASNDGGGAPQVYADNQVIAGVGTQMRLFRSRAALFAQVGQAFALVGEDRDVRLDFRAGAAGHFETRGCSPAPRRGAALHVVPCADAYGAAAYFSRFEHDAVAFARGRAGATWLVTGQLAWTLLAEAQTSVDRVGHPYDNFVEGGVGHRWRLLRPIKADLLASANAGAILRGRPAEPVPADRDYVELRLLAATFMEF